MNLDAVNLVDLAAVCLVLAGLIGGLRSGAFPQLGGLELVDYKVRIVEGVLVTGFEFDRRRVTRVLTDQGAIDCEIVVNAAGIWARDVARPMR